MSDYNITKLSDLRDKLDAGDIDKIVCLLRAVEVLESSFLVTKMYLQKDTEHNYSWVYELLEDIVQSKLNILLDREIIGGFVEALYLLGSSKLQALQATSEWLIMSETKVRNANVFFRKHYNQPTVENIIHYLSKELRVLLKTNTKPFPKNYIKAEKAYELFLNEIKKFEEEEQEALSLFMNT